MLASSWLDPRPFFYISPHLPTTSAVLVLILLIILLLPTTPWPSESLPSQSSSSTPFFRLCRRHCDKCGRHHRLVMLNLCESPPKSVAPSQQMMDTRASTLVEAHEGCKIHPVQQARRTPHTLRWRMHREADPDAQALLPGLIKDPIRPDPTPPCRVGSCHDNRHPHQHMSGQRPSYGTKHLAWSRRLHRSMNY